MVNTPNLIKQDSHLAVITIVIRNVMERSNGLEPFVRAHAIQINSVRILLQTKTLVVIQLILIMIENQAFVHEPDIVCQYCMKLVPVSRFKAHLHDEHLEV